MNTLAAPISDREQDQESECLSEAQGTPGELQKGAGENPCALHVHNRPRLALQMLRAD